MQIYLTVTDITKILQKIKRYVSGQQKDVLKPQT